MINIDDAIIQALIGAVIPAVCTVLSWFVSAFHFQHDKDRELFESQLSDLYEPLVGIIIRYHHELTDEEIHEITKLMCDHNSKAPPMLLDAWESVLKSGITSWPHFNSVLQSNFARMHAHGNTINPVSIAVVIDKKTAPPFLPWATVAQSQPSSGGSGRSYSSPCASHHWAYALRLAGLE